MKSLALFAACLFMALDVAAQPVTGLWVQRVASSGVASTPRTYLSPADTFSVTQPTRSTLDVRVNFSQTSRALLTLQMPDELDFTAGAYENAWRPFLWKGAGLDFFNELDCPGDGGRFSVLEAVTDNHSLVSGAINFERRCENGDIAYGELRIASAVPFTVDEASGSTQPDPFAFFPRRGVVPGSLHVSNEVTIYGVNAPAGLTIANGEYSVNGGPFVNVSGAVSNRDRVRVRTTGPTGAGQTSSATLTIGRRAAEFALSTYAVDEAYTAFYYRSEAGHYIGLGRTLDGHAPDWKITGTRSAAGQLEFRIEGPRGIRYSLMVGTGGSVMAPGTYEGAIAVPGPWPRIDLRGEARGCTGSGRFVVHEIQVNINDEVEKFSANFQHRCDGKPETLFGEIRLNSSILIAPLRPAGDSEPDAFAFPSPGVVNPGVIATSLETTLYGFDQVVPLSIAGGEYSLNGGPFTSAAATAVEGDRVRVRRAAPTEPGRTGTATLTAGSRNAAFAVTSWSETTPLTGIAMRDSASYPGARDTDGVHLSPPNGFSFQTNSSTGSISFSIETRDYERMTVWIAPVPGGSVQPGTYENTMGYSSGTPTRPFLDVDVSGGHSCFESTGRFVIHEIVHSESGALQRFAGDFEHLCPNSPAPVRAEVRYQSSVPFSGMQGTACQAGADRDGDSVMDCAELALGTNAYVKDNPVFTNARAFAMQQYRDFLSREGESAGVDYWTGRIANATVSRAAVVEHFLNSPEFSGVVAPVARLYFAYFLRIPDKAGLDFWVDYRLAGNAMESISNAFAGSAEFASTYGALDNAAFVDLVYRNVLGRAPDAAGLAYWRGELDAGRMTRGQVMLAFSESPEYTGITTNEIFVVMTYLGMLQRAPEPAGYAFWVDYMDKGNSGLALINGFLGAAEYRSRFLP